MDSEGGSITTPPRPPSASGPDVMPVPTAAQLQAAAETFAMLAAPTRLHIVWLLAREDADVGTLAKAVGAPLAAVSQHLSKMRLSGLVTARREGRRQVYSVEDPHVVTLVEQIFEHIAPDGSIAP